MVQGITGGEGTFHARACIEYGTRVVAGVTPGKGGILWENKVPVFNQQDPGTEAIVLIGEIGGTAEQEAAAFIRKRVTKPVTAFIAGGAAPPGRRMGHAGAIVTGTAGRAEEKKKALVVVGVRLAESPAEIPEKIGGVTVHHGGRRDR